MKKKLKVIECYEYKAACSNCNRYTFLVIPCRQTSAVYLSENKRICKYCKCEATLR